MMKKHLSILLVIGFFILLIVWLVFRNHDDVLDVLTAIISFLSVEVLCLTLYEQVDHNRLSALLERKSQIFEIANSIHFRLKGNNSLREYGFFDLDLLDKARCPNGCSIEKDDYRYLLSVLDTLRMTIQEFLIINQVSEITEEQFNLNKLYAKGFSDVILRLYESNKNDSVGISWTASERQSTETDEETGRLLMNTTEDVFPCLEANKNLAECIDSTSRQFVKGCRGTRR